MKAGTRRVEWSREYLTAERCHIVELSNSLSAVCFFSTLR